MSSDTSSISEHQGRMTEAQLRSRNFQLRVSTPDTDVTEHPQEPDITLFCEKCGSFILLRLLQEHRKYHSALHVLDYKDAKGPDSVASLLKRRQAVLGKMKSRAKDGKPLSMSLMQKINDAYELLKSYMEETYEDLIQTREMIIPECRGLALNCSAKCARAVGICSHDNQRWKNKMEDTRVFQDFFGNDKDKCFFAIYDGHNGRFAGDIAANDFHHFLLNEMTKFDPATLCTCTLNLAEHNDIYGYNLDRPRPVIRKNSIRHILHEESRNIIQQIMHTCQENMTKLDLKTTQQQTKKETKSKVVNKRENDPFAEKMEIAFKNSYQFVDYILSYGIDEQSRVRWSGCSAVTCVIKRTGEMEEDGKDEEYEEEGEGGNGEEQTRELGVLYVANAGNTHAVICQNGEAVRLTRNHTPQSSHERARVLRAGSSVKDGTHGGRVNGVLDTTRGLGNHGDPLLKAAVLAEPHTLCITLDSQSEFLILASNGLWEVLSEQEAISLVKQMMPGQDVPQMQRRLMSDSSLRDLYGTGLNLVPSVGTDNQDLSPDQDTQLEGDRETNNQRGIDSHPTEDNGPIKPSSRNGEDANRKIKSANGVIDSDLNLSTSLPTQQTSASAPPFIDGSVTEGDGHDGPQNMLPSPRFASINNPREDDNSSDQTEFESMISALMENDDGNDADIETLTELHTIYAQSRLQEVELGNPTKHEMYRNLAQQMSERLVQSALLAGSRDNITVLIVLLPGCKI